MECRLLVPDCQYSATPILHHAVFLSEIVLMSKSLKLIVESMLYAAEKPLSAREIHAIIPDAKLAEIKSGTISVLLKTAVTDGWFTF